MDIFVRQVPAQATEKQLRQFFRPLLTGLDITVFDVNKFKNKPLATIAVLTAAQGNRFLDKYGVNSRAARPLYFNGHLLACSVSRNAPTDIQLRGLMFEKERQIAKTEPQSKHGQSARDRRNKAHATTTFSTDSTSCGLWVYDGDRLTYQPHFIDARHGSIVLGLRQVVLLLEPEGSPVGFSADRIDINYFNVHTVLIGPRDDPTVTFTSWCPPKFFMQVAAPQRDMYAMLAQMNIRGQQPTQPKKKRLSCISPQHQLPAGMCFVYQIRLSNDRDLPAVHSLITRNRDIMSAMIYPTPTNPPTVRLRDSMTRLNFDLTDQSRAGSLPFDLRFQIVRLVQNGKLPPEFVRALIPFIQSLYRDFGRVATHEAICRLYLHLSSPGPEAEACQYSMEALQNLLTGFAQSYDDNQGEDAYSPANRHSHIVLIHKLNVTPAGVYLEGPFAEVTNRVLRTYPDHHDHFLRVTFMDEDGESFRYDPQADLQEVYHARFKKFLDGTYHIADQGFSFLGFSHSSLRSQTCWFMSPFFHDGELMIASKVIRQLGDFSMIRSPARCAARIGQAFTDTTGAVEIEAGMLGIMDDVKRDGRVFSDGVGTISESLLKRIWRIYGTSKPVKPTVLQIRFAGAKGVVALDSRLPEDELRLRGSMIKFYGSPSNKIEICGAAFSPLPMVLNKQIIKILEDLGVNTGAFLSLQTAAVQRLRLMTESTINASTLLDEGPVSKVAQLATLLEHLSDIGLEYGADTFLRDVVEMAVITNLRDIKYRGRIPVRNGVTLYGIMDETDYLQEGEIYVVIDRPNERGKKVLTGGKVVITRSPALHPGDVRVVRAINVPDHSPLSKLSNCVVFSQRGTRDLPSQLSGGDLDGDLYNVIFEPSLMPTKAIPEPADYPRAEPVELVQEVKSKDMSDFFIRFMETDQLGQISTVHLQLADQKLLGVFDPDCIKLAAMASTAVDFSKTGIPVDMRECPRRDRNRPDFMAPSPRAIVESGSIDLLPESDEEDMLENDPVANLDPESRRTRYYRSHKALGMLYRAIDEHQFLSDLHKHRKLSINAHHDSLMPRLWDYIKRNNVLVEWENYRHLARQIKDAYEVTLLDLLYQSAPSPNHPLTESEVFSGTILGRKGGAQSRRLREMTQNMRDRFGEILDFTVSRIINGDADGKDRASEALPRAIACLAVGVEENSLFDRKVGGQLRSWKYVAAGVCLKEMKRWLAAGLGRVTLPRC
ncbi:hypothetical protein AAFC00_006650 [Neodothiora populina]|uniref:RNA-dependent RNA polymerase n=1 Tax=Neodothiora populina TaxID=2781224 RepID=A0ABR3PBX2_9PEZI